MIQTHLDDTLLFIINILDRLKIPYVVIGGIAVSHWAEPRYTTDVDLTILIDEKGWGALKEETSKTSSVWTMIQMPQDEKVPDLCRLMWNGILIDLQISKTEHQNELIRRASRVELKGQTVALVSPEDLFVLKLLADRTRDISDLEGLVVHQPNLDMAYIRKWCRFWEIEKRLDRFLLKNRR